jgi:hypothetical protein
MHQSDRYLHNIMASAYIRRAFNWRQMDLDYTLFQMLSICTSPRRLYQLSTWRKRTKNQWARDDPAFVLILAAGLLVSTLAYSVALKGSFVGFLVSALWVVLTELLGLGVIIALLTNQIAKHYMVKEGASLSEVEVLFSFDIHCNSYVPVYIFTHFLQYLLLPVLLGSSFPSVLLSVLLYGSALSLYCLHTVAGYSVMPFLRRTEAFLLPICVCIPVFLGCLLLRVNLTEISLAARLL